MTGREVIDVLQRYYSLSWYRCRNLSDSSQAKYPPVIVWRYNADEMESDELFLAEKAVQKAVFSYTGEVDWVLYFTGRNWVLVPKEVKEIEDSGEYRVDMEILIALGEKDPGFGVKENQDLVQLARHIEKCLANKNETHLGESQS
ncbi:hypothetical protein [Aestuariispira ectoiniformans]|uniref:hypothetical protein n=1 Tax=Aestuariispira ectoiniformans TaxID=2775080 RepID=UPI00223B2F69|nr:hypothetical protein [Aestuariispira ectoiniformans]